MNKRKPLDERRAEIVEAGLSVAMREGVESVTVRRVAQAAGISLGTVHYCFDDKDAMLRAMGRAIAMRASEPVLAALDVGPDRTALAEGTVEALLVGLKQNQHMRLLTFEFAVSGARTPVLREVAQAHLKQSIAMTREYLQRLADVAGVRYRTEVGTLARMTALRIDGIELAWMVDQDDEAAREGFAVLARDVFDEMEPV
ncbi:transcriptional regulator, TetR family [Promicromonospora umidemergens]|uniref:HTH tetR-type domain-containing protein n=1 Tax=Promicromonospora umidemergens TaxID=629679 RepID=A0ABP8WUR7_9MICO|nr:TetR/AcrR family transcriptional regulator [Promicromonospora umidemergens]MCP2283509.1 transcriptional regulator, TetR family [Promicromonospora umidemergens]